MVDYIQLITGRDLRPLVDQSKVVFPKFTTVNPSYHDKLKEMKDAVRAYFEDQTLERPLLYLVLGPPGAGKSHLMKSLVEQLKDGKQTYTFQSVNVSEVLDPREIHGLYENVAQNNEDGVRTITLFDEVDVRWQDGSAIKHLINPIYDGKYWDGGRFRKFGRCAFFFAGSYLLDRETLIKTQKLLAGVDMSRFLLDCYMNAHRAGDTQAQQQVSDTLAFCYTQQKWRGDVDPRADSILYLRNLEKIRDFLSRIAGNIFEMIDVSAPLHVTKDAFAFDGDVQPAPSLRPVEVVRLAKKRDQDVGGFVQFRSPSEPILEYKQLLLGERLLRVINMIERRFRSVLPEGTTEVLIERTLLNYLASVPLINGMRSLEQLINHLDRPKDVTIAKTTFKPDQISMMIQNANEFADPTQVWYRLLRANPRMSNLMAAAGVTEGDPIRVPVTL
jgi:hypothetical protein